MSLPWSKEDNWRGIGNAHERRKIQNRINQRARRSRRRNEAKDSGPSSNYASVSQAHPHPTLRRVQASLVRRVDFEKIVEVINVRDPEAWTSHSAVHAFEAFIYNNWAAHAPRPALLPGLVRFNLARAIMTNAKVLGITTPSQLDDGAISCFNLEGPRPTSTNLETGTLPTGLQPTGLQCRTRHHPWLDFFPIPQMRDNLFCRGLESFDEDDLCRDMIGLAGHSDAAFVVWGDSWDPYGWEVTERFARSSWGWTIAGCWELYLSTNKWRAQRGEPPLFSARHKSQP